MMEEKAIRTEQTEETIREETRGKWGHRSKRRVNSEKGVVNILPRSQEG